MIDRLWRWQAVSGGMLILLVAWIAGCEGSATRTGEESAISPRPADLPVLRIGVARNMPPIIFTEDGRTVGLEADLARGLAAELGREPRFVPMHWPDLIFELRQQRIDIIMAGMSITEARRAQVAFAKPYAVVGQKALVRAADRATLSTTGAVLTMTGRVGVEQSSTAEQFVRRQLADAKVVAYPAVQRAVEALGRREVEAVIHDSPTIAWLQRQYADLQLWAVPGLLTRESLAWAVHPENEQLLAEANRVLAEWKRTGHLRRMLDRWIPASD
jgi:polar amino acid transport system substrate-binding protein